MELLIFPQKIPWNSMELDKFDISKYCCWYLIDDYMLFGLKTHRNATYCIDFNIVVHILNTPV